MEVLHDLESLRSLPGPVYLAIGIFDGLHRGHRALIEEAQADAQKTGGTAVVMTFEPHPMMFFQRGEKYASPVKMFRSNIPSLTAASTRA